jgi:hypothetical protein
MNLIKEPAIDVKRQSPNGWQIPYHQGTIVQG